MLTRKIRDPLFARKLLLTFNIHIFSYELKDPKAERIYTEHVKDGTKYLKFMKLPEVTAIR
jgi:hypothetical protein